MGILRSEGVVYKPVDEVDLSPNSDEVYISPNVKAPRMAGFLVKLFAWLLECKIIGAILLYVLKKDNLIHKLVTFAEVEAPPMFVPLHHPSEDPKEQRVKCIQPNLTSSAQVNEALECLPPSLDSISLNAEPSFRHRTIMDYAKAYRSGVLTPVTVAKRFIAAIDSSSSPSCNMSFFINYDAKHILKQATDSALRYEKGEPLSILDGVPVAIKDEIDCTPYPTTGGTKWLHKFRTCTSDASCVKCLRSCGAILVGKTNMHELGTGISGINPHYGTTRNPYNMARVCGGSSSGSAAVVCAGLCPVALGVDGGGSVRLPAALCGVVGFKPTFGRVPHSGVLPLNWTVGMVGILAGTVEDALITYAALTGQSNPEKLTPTISKVELPLLNTSNFTRNIKLAMYGEWFNDCDPDIRICCSHALDMLQKHYGWEDGGRKTLIPLYSLVKHGTDEGLLLADTNDFFSKIVAVTIPEIEAMRLAHYLTIGSECTAALDCHLQKLKLAELGWDTRVALSIYAAFNGMEYIKAQRIRNRQRELYRRIFSEVDVIVSPTTGVTAYPIKDDAIKTGELDYINGAALVRYQIAGNFLGLPAITVPIGYDKDGMPIGLQFIGKPWSEATLLHVAFAMQALCISDYKKPLVFYDLLKQGT